MSERPNQHDPNADSSNVDPREVEADELTRSILDGDAMLDPDAGYKEELPARLHVDPDEEAADELTRSILYGPKLDPDATDELVSESGDNKPDDAATHAVPPDHGSDRPSSD